MKIKECFVTANGISCIYNVHDYHVYIGAAITIQALMR